MADEYPGNGLLVHLCTAEEWDAARASGELRPASLAEAGFVHLSAPEQVHLPANRIFPGRTDLILLYVDPAVVNAPLRWEPGVPADPEAMLFPHLYGALPAAAIIRVEPYRPEPGGLFARLV